MTNVIGPIDLPTWRTMLMLRENISWLKPRNDQGKYDISIRKQKSILDNMMDEVLGRAA